MASATIAPKTGAPSLERVFQDYAGPIHGLARRLLSQDADAEDVTQDIFVQLLRKLPSFRGEAAFPTWLHRVTVNAVQAFRRKNQVRERHRLHGPLDYLQNPGPARQRRGAESPEEIVPRREACGIIEAAVGRLPPSLRDVYVLADVEEMSNPRIASRLGLPLATVKGRLHRARLVLRHALAPYFLNGSARKQAAGA